MTIAILMLLTFLLVSLEVIIPSGGALSILAAVFGIAALVSAFSSSQALGWTVVGGLGVGIPAFAWLGFKILPYTPFVLGTRIEGHAKMTGLEKYRGRNAITVTQLRLSGKVEINGRRFDAISEGEIIEPRTEVVVVDIRTGELVVKKA